MKYRSVLLLNMGYMPIGVLSWRKAVNLVVGRQKAHVVEEYEEKRSACFDAAVIRLIVTSPNPYSIFEKQKFSKRNVFIRDKYLCQYCEKRLSGKDLTIDHVTPRYSGGKTSYLNCVTSCKKCNVRKGNTHLEKLQMRLLKPVRKPNMYDIFSAINIPEEWSGYLKY